MTTKIRTYNESINRYISQNNFLTSIQTFIFDINQIINDLCNGECTKITNFFIKSYYILLFYFNEYNPYSNGRLLGNSGNCLFTIANFKFAKEEENKSYFIKVIDFSTQYYQSPIDLAIYDIICAIIFERILSFDNYRKYRDYISVYKSSSLSYKNSVNSTLNFNEIKDYYDGNNLVLNKIPHNNNEVILLIYEAIKEPNSINDIFVNYYTNQNEINKEMVLNVLKNIYDIYQFLIDIGINYGFMHNDLHFGNILYNRENNKLVLIDFGHSIFSKYIDVDISSTEINEIINKNFIKLNYNEKLNPNEPYDIRRFYKPDMFRYNISIASKNGNYFGIIYDLMTFVLNLYVRFLLFLYLTDKEKAIEFEKDIQEIIIIQYTGNSKNEIEDLFLQNTIFYYNLIKNRNLDILFRNYKKIKAKYLNGNLADNYIEGLNEIEMEQIFKIILEGLLYVALLLQTGNYFSNNTFFTGYQIMIKDLDKFKNYIDSQILINSEYKEILGDDYFFKYFISQVTQGGFNNGTTSVIRPNFNIGNESQISFKPVISTSDISQEQLEKTAYAYNKIYNDKARIKEKLERINTSFSSKTGGKKRILKSYNK